MMGGMKRKIRCGGRPMTAIVLAGGRGRRMKADKARLDVGGKTLLEHVLAQVEPYFDEVLISISPGQDVPLSSGARTSRRRRPALASGTPSPRLRIVRDETSGLGPIGGLLAGLKAARNDACLAVACDIPEVPSPLLRSLARAAGDADIAVAVDPAGHFEPLCAVYRRPIVPAVESLLETGERSLLPLYRICRTAVVRLGDARRLTNLNTREDYEAYLRRQAEKLNGPDRPAGRPVRRNGTGRRSRPRG
jgi:molybdenum cofactor guanylyltransferase